MIGFFVAGAATAGLFHYWRRRRGGRHLHWRLRRLSRRLKATPAQEAALTQSAQEIFQVLRQQDPWTRFSPIVTGLTADSFDREQTLTAMRAAAGDSFQNTLLNAVERLRATLDLEQRKILASMLTRRLTC